MTQNAPLSSPRRRGPITTGLWNMGPRFRGDDNRARWRSGGLVALCATVALLSAAPALAQEKSIVVASTTSTQDSGLFGHILPLFKAKTGIEEIGRASCR